MSDPISIVGFLAGFIAIAGYLPQIFKSYKLKKMNDVSVWLVLLFTMSALLWTIYGIYKNDKILSTLCAATFSLALTLIFMKLKYEGKLRFDSSRILRVLTSR